MVGPLYASARDVEAMSRFAETVHPGEFLQWFLHGLRIAPDAGHLGRRFWNLYGHLTFDEMAVPFAAAGLDVASGQRLLLRQGRVGPAVEASIRPPIILRPTLIDGRHLVDGGLQNAVPVDATYALGATLVIAIDIGGSLSLPRPLRPLSAMTGHAYRRRSRRPDSLHGQMGFLGELLAKGRQTGPRPDFLIKPNLAGISALSPFQTREALRRGEAAARAALPKLRPLLTAAEARPPAAGA
jgi:NTE family protein